MLGHFKPINCQHLLGLCIRLGVRAQSLGQIEWIDWFDQEIDGAEVQRRFANVLLSIGTQDNNREIILRPRPVSLFYPFFDPAVILFPLTQRIKLIRG